MKIPSPCFVLDESKLIQNFELIDRVQKEAGIEIILAFKGFAMWSTFPVVKQYIKGATASSLNEVKLCNEEMGVKSHTYCVAYSSDEFEEIVSRSSHITFNSLAQYHKYIDLVPKDVSIGLRVNPRWSDVETDLYNPSSPVSRLGVTSENLESLPERVEGLHFHVLCESDSYALEKVLESLEDRFGGFLSQVKWVNMGGGHLMTREDYDTKHLIDLLTNFREKHQVKVILEPGSAFAWQTGDLYTRVLDVVENGGQKTAIFDGSFTCHMPDCLEMPYRPKLAEGSDEPVEGWHAYRLGGVSCLAGDFLDEYWFEKPLKEGDAIIFKDMIHYTMVKTSTFNGVKHPSIGILRKDGNFELIREFGYEDFKNRLS
ncbi:carboxynorspermidine decarboxylase [Ekhidna lutea]|uniref:Carboxynorspermidine/carboxyspermidine decarboxylase n=1 Tax=Ekhidna lutea TaxID=447679 RepID=A0A239L7H5_EKHLU|nr:carboxynorspermidine decarboxylase [Ekhidna lutea]SNT25952.1 carboxynorspermidine decarboxylase [Ekhidna lutea]